MLKWRFGERSLSVASTESTPSLREVDGLMRNLSVDEQEAIKKVVEKDKELNMTTVTPQPEEKVTVPQVSRKSPRILVRQATKIKEQDFESISLSSMTSIGSNDRMSNASTSPSLSSRGSLFSR